MGKDFTVLDLIDIDLKEHNSLNLRCIGGRRGLGRVITVPNLNRPGLAVMGFFESFAYERIQVFGRGETAASKKLVSENKFDSIIKLLSYKVPCCIFSHNLSPEQEFFEEGKRLNVPCFRLTCKHRNLQSALPGFWQTSSRPKKASMRYW